MTGADMRHAKRTSTEQCTYLVIIRALAMWLNIFYDNKVSILYLLCTDLGTTSLSVCDEADLLVKETFQRSLKDVSVAVVSWCKTYSGVAVSCDLASSWFNGFWIKFEWFWMWWKIQSVQEQEWVDDKAADSEGETEAWSVCRRWW